MSLNLNNRHFNWIQHHYGAIFKHRQQAKQCARFSLWSGLLVAAIAVGLSNVGAWELLEQQSYNQLHHARRVLVGAPAWDDRVVVVAIDEASVARFGHFPWTRDRYADLLNRLRSAQPAAVTFDILFTDPTAQDPQFAQAIVESANVVLATGADSSSGYLNVSPSIADEASGFFLRGDMSNHADVDGVSRQLPFHRHSSIPALSMATLQVYAESLENTSQATAQNLLDTAISSRTKDKTIWINWPGETTVSAVSQLGRGRSAPQRHSLHTYSYADVLDGRIDASLFQNRIVLVGTTLVGLDPLRTPFQTSSPTSGVYLYAAAINNLLNHSFLRRPPLWQVTLLLTALALSSSYLLRRQGAYQRLAVVIGFPAVWGAIALAVFMSGWWIPVAAPIGTVLIGALAIQLYEQQEKQQLMALFSMNVSPGTAELIWRHKGVILHQGELEAQKLTATVLFMDIRGFTGIAETLPSQQLLPWLNQYFETMTDCIMQHGGMVDKYIGDAIMAVFGAPLPRNRPEEVQADAIAALKAALEMHERLRSLNRQLAAQKLPVIKFGIGIHTGPLIGGTVGNRHRLNYSLFGDTVNIAARLESMTKTLPKDAPFKLLLSADTAQHTRAHFPNRLFQSGQLRGRAGHTDAYTITAPAIVAPSPCSFPKAERPGRYSRRWANYRRYPATRRLPQRGAAQSR